LQTASERTWRSGFATTYELGPDGRVIGDGFGRPKEVVLHGKIELRRCD
jgi:hypothetical protein